MDALVAEKVLGWRRGEHLGLKRMVWKRPPDFDTSWQDEAPAYSTNIADTWEVVEKIKDSDRSLRDFTILWDMPHWIAGFLDTCFIRDGLEWEHKALGESAPHAICLAALKAVGAL